MTLEPPAAGTAPAVAFTNPDSNWQYRFNQPSMRVLLVLLEKALEAKSKELMVLTVKEHHAAVMIVPDRTPVEIAQVSLKYYDGMRKFLAEGLFARTSTPVIQWQGAGYMVTWEFVERDSGEGFTINLAPRAITQH